MIYENINSMILIQNDQQLQYQCSRMEISVVEGQRNGKFSQNSNGEFRHSGKLCHSHVPESRKAGFMCLR